METKNYLALISIVLIAATIQTRTVDSPANSMWTQPENLTFTTTTTPIGYKFNLTIYATLDVPSYAWQFYLTYNNAHLNATGCWYSAGAKSEWAGTRSTSPQTPSYGTHNETHNYILFAESLQGLVETPPGTYSLAIVEFEVISVPPEGETYQSQIRLDIPGAFNTYVLDAELEEITPLTFQGTTYTYSSPAAPPPSPTTKLYVDPPEIIDPTLLPPATFTVNVTVDDVQNLYGYEYNMSFNSQILTCLLVTIHDAQGETNYIPELQIDNPRGFIWVRATYYPPANPITTTNPVALTTIKFRVKSMGSSVLDLHETNLTDNAGNPIPHEVKDGVVMTLVRDIAITNVTLSSEWAYAGWPINISVTAKNLGLITESFNVSAYYDTNLIGAVEIIGLNPSEEKTVTLTWSTSGVAQGTYTISAKAPILPYETNTTNNLLQDGTAKIRIMGDINGDGSVDIKDVGAVSKAFGATPNQPNWNQAADLNRDGKIDIMDVAIVSKRFGSTCYSNKTSQIP